MEYLGGKGGRADGEDRVRGEQILDFAFAVGEALQQHHMLAAEAFLGFAKRVKMKMPMHWRQAIAKSYECSVRLCGKRKPWMSTCAPESIGDIHITRGSQGMRDTVLFSIFEEVLRREVKPTTSMRSGILGEGHCTRRAGGGAANAVGQRVANKHVVNGVIDQRELGHHFSNVQPHALANHGAQFHPRAQPRLQRHVAGPHASSGLRTREFTVDGKMRL